MNLKDIAKQLLKEDSWGTNPAAGGGMSPGRPPTAVTPPPLQSANIQDIAQSLKNFEQTIEQQEETATKKFVEELKKKFVKKTVTVEASKGGINQPNTKQYTISVTDVDVRYMDEKYYVVFTGTEPGKKDSHEYYLEDFKIKSTPTAPTAPQSGLKSVGGVVPLQPTSYMAPTAKNILPTG